MTLRQAACRLIRRGGGEIANSRLRIFRVRRRGDRHLIPHLVTRRLKSAIGNPGTAQFELLSENRLQSKTGLGTVTGRSGSANYTTLREVFAIISLIRATRGSTLRLPGLTGDQSRPRIRADTLIPTCFVRSRLDFESYGLGIADARVQQTNHQTSYPATPSPIFLDCLNPAQDHLLML